MTRIACIGIVALFALTASAADKTKQKDPTAARGNKEVFEWKSKDGLVYRYRLPKKYDAEKGCNLTLILHGSNLDRRWGFANHSYKTFRPDDLVVSPDGTTPNGRGGFNFLDGRKDTKRLHALQEELSKAFKIRGVYLYGHSQGSFFSFLYAGEYPEDVNGVVGHASGVWAGTQQTKRHHHQAIVLMHGTQDPVVPYWQSPASYGGYVKAKYPMVRLRSLEGWNHWPAEHNSDIPHTSQQLAWCEGMTTDDPDRMEWCFDFIASCKSRDWNDYAAVYTLARHIVASEHAADALKKRAEKAADAVAALAEAHVAALKVPDKLEFEAKPWIGHLPIFLRDFLQVPACDAFRKQYAKILDKQKKEGDRLISKYYSSKKEADSFEAGVEAVKKAYLYYRCHDRQMLDNLGKWAKDAKKLKISRKALKDYEKYVVPLRKQLKKGLIEYAKINRKAKKM